MSRSRSPGNHGVPAAQSGFRVQHRIRFRCIPSPGTPDRPFGGILFPLSDSTTCMSASTSASCASKARRRPPPSPNAGGRPGAHLALQPAHRFRADAAGQGACWRWPRKSSITSKSSTASRRIAITPATSRRWICSAFTCSASSTSPTTKPRWSICAPPRSRCSWPAQPAHAHRPVRCRRPLRFQRKHRAAGRFRELALDQRPDLRAAVQAVDKGRYRSPPRRRQRLDRSHVRVNRRIRIVQQSAPSPYSSASASAFRCAFSTATRAKSCAPKSISAARSASKRPPRRRSSATWIPPTSRSVSAVALLTPYKATYLAEALDVRDKVAFAYQRGGAALLDYLQAQQDYRDRAASYLNLVGSYLLAAGAIEHGGGTGSDAMILRRGAPVRTNPAAHRSKAAAFLALLLPVSRRLWFQGNPRSESRSAAARAGGTGTGRQVSSRSIIPIGFADCDGRRHSTTRAGIERHRRRQPRHFAQRAGDLARLGPHSWKSMPASATR